MTTDTDGMTVTEERCEQCGNIIPADDWPGAMRSPHLWCWNCATGNGWSMCRDCAIWTDDWHSWANGDGPYCRTHADIEPSGCDCIACVPDLDES